ncbi:MAG TPA: MOP flippase family protein [Burkholderiales bacterium]|nr:MOP flippase family protein [Burkholderiales bacterium]
MGLRRQAISGAAWTAVSTTSCAALQFVQLVVLARLLQPEDFGLMALIVVFVGFFHLYSDAGLSSAIVQRQQTTHEELSSLFWLNVLAGLGMLAVLLLCAPAVSWIYGEPRLRPLLALAAFAFLVLPISQQFQARLQKALRFDTLAAVDVLSTAAGVATAIFLAYRGFGVRSLVLGFLASTVVRAAALFALGMRDWRPQLRLRVSDLGGYVRFGGLHMAERTVNYLGSNLDRLLIGALVGTHGLGLYSIASQLVMRPLQVVNPIFTRVAFPIFSRVQNEDQRLRAGFLDGIRAITFVLFPIYMGMIVLAEPLVEVILGERWLPSVPILQAVSILGFFYCLGNPLGVLLLAKARIELGLYLNVWRVVLYALAISVGARWGLQGIAYALVIATAAGLFPLGFIVRWLLVRMRPSEYLSAWMPTLISAVVMGVVLWVARDFGPVPGAALGELILYTVAGAAVFLVVAIPWQRAFLASLRNVLR